MSIKSSGNARADRKALQQSAPACDGKDTFLKTEKKNSETGEEQVGACLQVSVNNVIAVQVCKGVQHLGCIESGMVFRQSAHSMVVSPKSAHVSGETCNSTSRIARRAWQRPAAPA